MYLPIPANTPLSINELVDLYDVAEGNPAGQTLSRIEEIANKTAYAGPAISFDLTWITANIRVDSLYAPNLTDCHRLSELPPVTVDKLNDIQIISDTAVNVPVFII